MELGDPRFDLRRQGLQLASDRCFAMSTNSTPLLPFIVSVPVCLVTAAAAEVTRIFSQGHWEQIIVVNEHRQPVGLVNLSKLMPYLMGKALDWQQSLSQTPIVESIATIPADMNWSQFCRHCQGSKTGTGPVALVKADGEFLGLLDRNSLLKHLANKEYECQLLTGEAIPEGSNVLYARQGIRPKQPEATKIPNSLMELLEMLPIPMRLQSNTGEVLRENQAWRSLVGSIPAPDCLGLETASEKLTPQASYAAQISLAQTATALFSPLCCPVSQENEPVLEETVGSWQFVKIPLGNSQYLHPELASLCSIHAGQWERGVCSPVLTRVGAIGQEYNRALTSEGIPLIVSNLGREPMWLVLATPIRSPQLEAQKTSAENAEMEQVRKDEFLLGISHELKTPITAILGLSSLLLNDGQHPLTQRQAQYAEQIRKSGRQLMKIVNNLVDLSRLETGQLELKPSSVDIAKVCQGAYQHVQQSLSDVGERRLLLEIAPNLEEIVADELRLQQMLFNLLSNAFKFTDSTGEIGLRVSNWSNNWIGFTVWDTGVGIKAAQQQLILPKLLKQENYLSQSSAGTGLGLVLTQGLAQLHGGEVTFISTEGKGSEFTLLLPAADARANMGEFPMLGSSLILIIETNPEIVSDLAEQLRELGYFCLVARSQSEALRKARCLQPHIIFLNVTNPMLSGAELLKQLKSERATCHIRAIAIASGSIANMDDIIVDDFLSLPVESKVLHKQISQLISQAVASPETASSDPIGSANNDSGTEPRKLTIMCLSASALDIACCSLFNNDLNSTPRHLVVEASDLEQAEMLAKIWKPDVLLFNDTGLINPLALLQELSEKETLASLPLVTLSQSTTQAANQFKGLSVFPCLVPTGSLPASSTLLQVIQVAAGCGQL